MKAAYTVLFFVAYSRLGLAQSTPIPGWWFSADPKSVMSDPLFPMLPLSTRSEILSQIDPKFAKMKANKQEAFLWDAETTYLPGANPPKQVFSWKPNDPAPTSEIVGISAAITKTVTARGLAVRASMDGHSFLGFMEARVRIQNDTTESINVRPQTFVVEVLKPTFKRKTRFFEYPSRVSYLIAKGGTNSLLAPNTPTERTTVRSATGQTVATVDAPDPVAREAGEDFASFKMKLAFSVAGKIDSSSLKEGILSPGASVEGDVYFEPSVNAQEIVLRIFLSELAFEIPFSLPKR